MMLGLEWISSQGEDRVLGENEWLTLSPGRYIPWRYHLPCRNGFTHRKMCSPALPRNITQVYVLLLPPTPRRMNQSLPRAKGYPPQVLLYWECPSQSLLR